MATFTKAVPVAMPLKMSEYGPPGSGKTLTALMFAEGLAKLRAKRIAFVDTERGTKTYSITNPARKVHPDAFDFDVLHTRSLADMLDAVKSLSPKTHGVIVIDSISHVWDAARDAWEAKNPNEKEIPLRAWGSIKRPYKELMKLLIDGPFDVIISGRQKTIFEEENGRLTNAGVGMRAEGETQFEPDTCLRFELVGKRGEEGIVTMFCEKDRYSVLSGRTFPNPTFKTIEALLPFLGTEAPPSEDDEERAAKDGELLDKQEKKAEGKAGKSAELFAVFLAELQAATDLASLGAVKVKANKASRSLTAEHTQALKLAFESKGKQFLEAAGV